jgi:hypothetical protein
VNDRITHVRLQANAKMLRKSHFPDLDIGWVAFCNLPEGEHGRCYPNPDNRMVLVNRHLSKKPKEVVDTLLHEFIHLYLVDSFGDRTHGERFKGLCLRLDLPAEVHCGS